MAKILCPECMKGKLIVIKDRTMEDEAVMQCPVCKEEFWQTGEYQVTYKDKKQYPTSS